MRFPPMDVLVVGGGVIGASIAWRLARQHARVVLFDAASVGAEASSAAAGMLSPAGEFDGASPLLELALKSLKQFPDYAASIETDSGSKTGLRHSGAVDVAITEEEMRSLADRAARQRSHGVRAQLLSGRQLAELAPLVRRDAIGGMHYPDELSIDPQALMQALERACLARGVILVERAPVVSVSSNAHSVRLSHPDRDFEAASAVIAAGAWSRDIPVSVDGEPRALPQSYPVKGHLLGYRLDAGSLAANVRHGHTYLLQRAGGFTIAGSSMENVAYDRSINLEVVTDIRARAATLVPSLAGLEPERVWTGFRPATETSQPHIGRFGSSRIWLAYGHFRNGILLAPATADQIAGDIGNVIKDLK